MKNAYNIHEIKLFIYPKIKYSKLKLMIQNYEDTK